MLLQRDSPPKKCTIKATGPFRLAASTKHLVPKCQSMPNQCQQCTKPPRTFLIHSTLSFYGSLMLHSLTSIGHVHLNTGYNIFLLVMILRCCSCQDWA